MANAWTYQKIDDVHANGEAGAKWRVGWYDYEGRRRQKTFGPGFTGEKAAERYRCKIENELMAGTYQRDLKKSWEEFRKEYEEKVVSRMAPRSQGDVKHSLDVFQRIVKPVRVLVLATPHIDNFITARRKEAGKKKGATTSPATVNKDLRHVKAALNVAVEWGYLNKLPNFRMLKEPRRLPTFITGEHFATVYQACEHARMPHGLRNTEPADWWRALLVFAYMTGWRIGDMLGLRRDDLDLDSGHAITRYEDNKGKRDEKAKLHPVVIEHLRTIAGCFDTNVFPWNHDRRTLDDEFHRIQAKAEIHLPCAERHEHTEACHFYGFHDLRRAFATMNADHLTADALQALMRHKSYLTTQVYINMARQMDEAVASLHVPEVLKKKTGG